MSDPNTNPDSGSGIDIEQSFVSHLVELRDRLIRAVAVVMVVFFGLCLYPSPGTLYDFLAMPIVAHLPAGATLIATNPIAPFMVPIKVTMLAALVISLPWVLYQIWAFVAPGLYAHEKRLVAPLIISSTGLFYSGMAFCYFFVFGKVFAFIQSFAPKSITAAPDIEAYLSFVLNMFLAFGAAFEVPVVLVILVRMGLVTTDKLKEYRGYFTVGAFVVAAVVTPPDVVSQLALAIPMVLLYEAGIWAAKVFVKHTQAPDADAGSEADKSEQKQA